MAIIGIDLGTTNSLAVAYIENHYELIPNQFGEYLTPSVISVYEDGSVSVGKSAKQRLVTHPQATTSLFKRYMGSKEEIVLNGKSFLPEECSALVVKQLMQDAQNYLQEAIEEVVISVPAYFNEFQRAATKKVGQILNVKVERLINEPSAAALANHMANSEDEAFIVFDFGGGTLDVSVVDCFDNVVSICAIAGDNHLGGSDFDECIAKDFCKNYHFDYDQLTKKQKESLLLQCESIKIALSTQTSVKKTIYLDQQEYAYCLDQEGLKLLSQPMFTRMRKVIAEAVNSSGFERGEIDQLVLVGGSSHMPIVKEFLQNLMNIPVVETKNMDHIVAMGLGTYIGIKQRKEQVRQLVLTDICPFSLGTGIYNRQDPSRNKFDILIPKNSVLPASKKSRYHTTDLGQENLRFSIYQGEGMYVEDNTLLDSYVIKVPINNKEHEEVDVTFSYDINSILCVDLHILSTNERKRYFVGGNQVEQAQVQSIVDASLKLNMQEDVDYLREYFLRLLEESSTRRQEIIRDYYERFEYLLELYANNLRKKTRLLQRTKEILAQLEYDNAHSDFFSEEELDFEDDDVEGNGYLS